MSIKNPETHRLASELSDLTGESPTGTVTESLRERLERMRGEQRRGIAAALLLIGRDVASRLPDDIREADPDKMLYDENGWPR